MKYQGDIAEIKFHLEAHERGFLLASPLRATQYDFLLDNGKRILRIQVKSTRYKVDNGYRIDARWRNSQTRYTPNQIDFIVGFVIPENAWYIIPVSEVKGANLAVYPHRENSKGTLEHFRDAWNLLE